MKSIVVALIAFLSMNSAFSSNIKCSVQLKNYNGALGEQTITSVLQENQELGFQIEDSADFIMSSEYSANWVPSRWGGPGHYESLSSMNSMAEFVEVRIVHRPSKQQFIFKDSEKNGHWASLRERMLAAISQTSCDDMRARLNLTGDWQFTCGNQIKSFCSVSEPSLQLNCLKENISFLKPECRQAISDYYKFESGQAHTNIKAQQTRVQGAR